MSCLGHYTKRCSRTQEWPGEVCVERCLPVAQFHIDDRRMSGDACVVHEYVQVAEMCNGLVDQRVHFCLNCNVGWKGHHISTVRLKFFGCFFEQSGIRNADQGGRYSGLQTVHVHNLFAKTRAVDEIAIDPVLLLIIEGILGSLFQLSVGTAMSPQPGVDPQGLHRDDGHYPLARPRPPFIANCLIALDDFTQANGATRIAPGSHKRTEDIKPNTDVIFAEMPAGSLLVFDGALWHAGGGNRTKAQRRRSINLNFNLSWLRQQENQYVGIPRTEWLKMPERLQRLLGFQKVNFLYGSVDYTDPLVYFKQNAALLK